MGSLVSKFEKLYGYLICYATNLQNPLLLLIRLYWGYQFYLAGSGKFENFERTVGFFTKLGIPMPELNVYMAAGTEMIGGLLLLVGLGSRLVSLPLVFTMLVAYFTADYEVVMNIFSDPKAFVQKLLHLYVFISFFNYLSFWSG